MATKKSVIPKISEAKVKKLSKLIRPVSNFATINLRGKEVIEEHPEGELYFLKKVHPIKKAFTWDKQPDKVAHKLKYEPFKIIETYHEYGYRGIFKASEAEVLSQLSKEDLKRCVAFDTHSKGFSADGELHIAETKLYENYSKLKDNKQRYAKNSKK